jgi:hypothetical protein
MSFSAPKIYGMQRPTFQQNVKDFRAITKSIKSKAFKEKAQEIVDLYVAKKILTVERR